MYGFVMMAKGEKHEFYNYSQSEILEWVDALKPYTVCLDLKEDWIVGSLIGKGSTAKVHRCERKWARNKYFAMKTIEKAHINQNRIN